MAETLSTPLRTRYQPPVRPELGQKNYISLYLMSLYAGDATAEEAFRSRWSGGRRLDMGTSCVRFRSADDLDLDLIGEAVSLWTPEQFVDLYSARRAGR